MQDVVSELLEERDAETVLLAAFALVHAGMGGDAGAEDDRDLSAALTVDTKRGKSGPGPKRETKAAASGKTRLWVSVGRKAGITPGDIVGAVTGESGLKGRDVGPVKVNEFFSLVDVPDAKARKVVKALNHCTIRGRKVKVKIDQA